MTTEHHSNSKNAPHLFYGIWSGGHHYFPQSPLDVRPHLRRGEKRSHPNTLPPQQHREWSTIVDTWQQWFLCHYYTCTYKPITRYTHTHALMHTHIHMYMHTLPLTPTPHTFPLQTPHTHLHSHTHPAHIQHPTHTNHRTRLTHTCTTRTLTSQTPHTHTLHLHPTHTPHTHILTLTTIHTVAAPSLQCVL